MKVGARWFLSVVLVMLGTVMLQAQVPAQSEECPNYNFQNLFFSDYFPGTKWDNSSGNLNITWSANNEFIQTIKWHVHFHQMSWFGSEMHFKAGMMH